MGSNDPTPGKRQFDQRGNFVGLWRDRSDDFYDAALAVWNTQAKAIGQHSDGRLEEVTVGSRPALLLMGLCLETLLKGLLVGRDPQLISAGKIDKRLRTHDLEKLFGQASLSMTDALDTWLVKRLSASVYWMSKYPIPTSAGNSDSRSPDWVNYVACRDDDFDRFALIRERISSEYKGISYVQILRPGVAHQ